MRTTVTLATCLLVAAAAAAQESPSKRSRPDPRTPAGLVPDPAPPRVEFTPAPPVIECGASARAGLPLRYEPAKAWDGIVTVSTATVRTVVREGKEVQRSEGRSDLALRVRLEPAGEPHPEGGRGFTVHASLDSVPDLGAAYGDVRDEDPEIARSAIRRISATARFSSRGILEHVTFALPPDCPRGIEVVLGQIESLLPLLIPPLSEGGICERGWGSTQYLASDLLWHHRTGYRYEPAPALPDAGGDASAGGTYSLVLGGDSERERPRDGQFVGAAPVNAAGQPHFPGHSGKGELRMNLARPITRHAVYTTFGADIGKWAGGGQPYTEMRVTIRAEDAGAERSDGAPLPG